MFGHIYVYILLLFCIFNFPPSSFHILSTLLTTWISWVHSERKATVRHASLLQKFWKSIIYHLAFMVAGPNMFGCQSYDRFFFILLKSKLSIDILVVGVVTNILVVGVVTNDDDVIIFTNRSARVGYDTRSFCKWSLTGLNSEFSFS